MATGDYPTGLWLTLCKATELVCCLFSYCYVAAMQVLPVCLSVCLSVCLFVHPVWTRNSKSNRCRNTQIGVNVPQGRSNRCANFQFKRSKFKIAQPLGGWLHDMSALGRHRFSSFSHFFFQAAAKHVATLYVRQICFKFMCI